MSQASLEQEQNSPSTKNYACSGPSLCVARRTPIRDEPRVARSSLFVSIVIHGAVLYACAFAILNVESESLVRPELAVVSDVSESVHAEPERKKAKVSELHKPSTPDEPVFRDSNDDLEQRLLEEADRLEEAKAERFRELISAPPSASPARINSTRLPSLRSVDNRGRERLPAPQPAEVVPTPSIENESSDWPQHEQAPRNPEVTPPAMLTSPSFGRGFRGVEGVIVVQIELTNAGKAADISVVVGKLSAKQLERLKALLAGQKYRAAKRNGKTIASRLIQKFVFKQR